jgi:isocitrate lyase
MRGWRECLAALGYRFQFITLAGWHALNLSMFELASAYRDDGMLGYSRLQQREFAREADGYRATRHQAQAWATSMPCRQRLHPGSFRQARHGAPNRHTARQPRF